MKKTFPLAVEGRQPARVLDSIKNEVRKYIKRERKKKLPEEVDFWDFNCRTGIDADSAESVHISKINASIDQLADDNPESIYIEILSKPGHRTKKPKENSESEEEE